MSAVELRRRVNDSLLREIKEARFPSVTMLNRVEPTLTTPAELEDLAQTLIEKVEETRHPSIAMLNRIESLLTRLEQAEQQRRQPESR